MGWGSPPETGTLESAGHWTEGTSAQGAWVTPEHSWKRRDHRGEVSRHRETTGDLTARGAGAPQPTRGPRPLPSAPVLTGARRCRRTTDPDSSAAQGRGPRAALVSRHRARLCGVARTSWTPPPGPAVRRARSTPPRAGPGDACRAARLPRTTTSPAAPACLPGDRPAGTRTMRTRSPRAPRTRTGPTRTQRQARGSADAAGSRLPSVPRPAPAGRGARAAPPRSPAGTWPSRPSSPRSGPPLPLRLPWLARLPGCPPAGPHAQAGVTGLRGDPHTAGQARRGQWGGLNPVMRTQRTRREDEGGGRGDASTTRGTSETASEAPGAGRGRRQTPSRPQREPLPTPGLGLPAPQLSKDKFLSSEGPSLWRWVVAAPANSAAWEISSPHSSSSTPLWTTRARREHSERHKNPFLNSDLTHMNNSLCSNFCSD